MAGVALGVGAALGLADAGSGLVGAGVVAGVADDAGGAEVDGAEGPPQVAGPS